MTALNEGPLKKIEANQPVTVEEMKWVRSEFINLVKQRVLTLQEAQELGGAIFLLMYTSGNPEALARVKRIQNMEDSEQQKEISKIMTEVLSVSIIPEKGRNES